MTTCVYCGNEAKHTLVDFYHEYGCPVEWYPVCDDHTRDYNPRDNDKRGCKTLYGKVITTKTGYGSDLGLSLSVCDVCQEYYFEAELTQEQEDFCNEHDLLVCPSCASHPKVLEAYDTLKAWYHKELTAYEARDIFKSYKIKRSFYVSKNNQDKWIRS